MNLITVLSHQNISGFDIPVNLPVRVKILQTLEYFLENPIKADTKLYNHYDGKPFFGEFPPLTYLRGNGGLIKDAVLAVG